MLLLKQNDVLLKQVLEGRRFALPNGDVVSPAQEGWKSGEFSLVAKPEAPDEQEHLHEEKAPKTGEELLAQERAAMVCSPMQGMLALGETEWAKVITYRDTDATWAEKVIIDKAGDWRRNSQNIAFFQHLLDMTDEQVDDLFRAAMGITA